MMKEPLLRAIAVLLVLWSVASVRGMGPLIAARKSTIEPLKPEPLRPFSEIESLLLRGALIAAAVPVIWFVVVLIRGAFRERREEKERRDRPHPP
jgi:hypothetical protein